MPQFIFTPAVQECLLLHILCKLRHFQACQVKEISVQSLSLVWLFVTPWTAACPPSLSIINSQSLLKLRSIELVMPPNHLSLRCPLLLLLSIVPSISSVQFSRSVVSDSLRPHEPQHARPPCPSPTPGVYPNSGLLSWWCHATISFSVVPFSSCLQSFPTSGSFQMSQLFASVLAKVLEFQF